MPDAPRYKKVIPLLLDGHWVGELGNMALRPFEPVKGMERDYEAVKACDLMAAGMTFKEPADDGSPELSLYRIYREWYRGSHENATRMLMGSSQFDEKVPAYCVLSARMSRDEENLFSAVQKDSGKRVLTSSANGKAQRRFYDQNLRLDKIEYWSVSGSSANGSLDRVVTYNKPSGTDGLSSIFEKNYADSTETRTFYHKNGSVKSRRKNFFDKDGSTLVLRPDFTPSIARSAAKYYTEDDMPVKLCYMGNTFINSNAYQGRLKETTQCGAELIGDGTVAADAEILAMVVESLLSSGLKEFQISVGHAQFFRGLAEAAGLDEEQQQELRELLANKNYFGVEEMVEGMHLNDTLKKLFSLLGSFETQVEELAEAKSLASDYPNILSAITDLEKLGSFLRLYGIEKYVSFELGIISNYHYYTGIIFAGYTFGTGEPVVKGGRYDRLLTYFGRKAPAIGFAIVVDQLLSALSRQKITLPSEEKNQMIVYAESKIAEAVEKAKELRAQGISVSLIQMQEGRSKDDYLSYAMKDHVSKVEFIEEA